jgi:hypothetical protein
VVLASLAAEDEVVTITKPLSGAKAIPKVWLISRLVVVAAARRRSSHCSIEGSDAWMHKSSTCKQTVSLGEMAAIRSLAGLRTVHNSKVAVELPAAMPWWAGCVEKGS